MAAFVAVDAGNGWARIRGACRRNQAGWTAVFRGRESEEPGGGLSISGGVERRGAKGRMPAIAGRESETQCIALEQPVEGRGVPSERRHADSGVHVGGYGWYVNESEECICLYSQSRRVRGFACLESALQRK